MMFGFWLCMLTALYIVVMEKLMWHDLVFSITALVACGVGAVLFLWAELS